MTTTKFIFAVMFLLQSAVLADIIAYYDIVNSPISLLAAVKVLSTFVMVVVLIKGIFTVVEGKSPKRHQNG